MWDLYARINSICDYFYAFLSVYYTLFFNLHLSFMFLHSFLLLLHLHHGGYLCPAERAPLQLRSALHADPGVTAGMEGGGGRTVEAQGARVLQHAALPDQLQLQVSRVLERGGGEERGCIRLPQVYIIAICN